MSEELQKDKIIEKITEFDLIEILINEKQDILFEGIIDPPYIYLHFERIVNSSKHFDIIKMVGHFEKKRKEVIAEVIVSK